MAWTKAEQPAPQPLTVLLMATTRMWAGLVAVGVLFYAGLCLTGVLNFVLTDVAAIVLVAGAIALLLSMEERAGEERPNLGDMTFAGFIYLLLARRRVAIALAFFVIAASVAAAYYFVVSLLKVEYQGTAGTLVVKLPGQTVYYRPLHPYGWENTQVRVKAGQVLEVDITGRVSPGLLQEATKIEGYIQKQIAFRSAGAPAGKEPKLPDKLRWVFTGPEGYPDSFYAQTPDIPSYTKDPLLTVRGKPHNAVIGIVVPEGEPPCHRDPAFPTPCEASLSPSAPGYDVTADAQRLYFLSSPVYPVRIEARQSGVLWLNINDADGLRIDNAGLFFVKIAMR
jgi:hypothetical protein